MYKFRAEPRHWDDRAYKDEWQDEVYRLANEFALAQGHTRVVDYGCGSGYKLMKYFEWADTVGIEQDPSLTHLRETYPDRRWGYELGNAECDLLICADVIEHMPDPAALLEELAAANVKHIFLSTPSLEILSEQGRSRRWGPPLNESHAQEWTTNEFRSFVWTKLRVLKHVVTCAQQGTQLIIAAPP